MKPRKPIMNAGYRKLLNAMNYCYNRMTADKYYYWYYDGQYTLRQHMMETFIRPNL